MKSNLLFLSIVLICVSFAHGGSIRGIVRDAGTLAPLEGVNVTAHVLPDSIAYPTITDSDGKYSISGIVPGNTRYTVVTHMSGYTMSYTRIDNLGSLDLVYDVFLIGEGSIPPTGGVDSSTVMGTIFTPTGGIGALIPIANALVRLTAGYQQFDVSTNTEGRYTKIIPAGLFSVAVSADGYKNLSITNVQAQQTGTTVDAVLQSTTSDLPTMNPGSLPGNYVLFEAYPNPFNPSTKISFSLPTRSFVSLKIFTILGSEVATLVSGPLPPGYHSQQWDAVNMPSGIYLCQLQAGSTTQTRKLILLR
jgi:hypothetical protein